MRYILWLTLGFSAACAAFAYFLPEALLPMLTVVFFLAAITGLVFFREEKKKAVAAVVCLGMAIGLLWCMGLNVLRLAPVRKLDATDQTLTVTVTDYHSKDVTKSYVPGVTTVKGKSYSVLIYLYDGLDLRPGDVITGSFYLRYTATGGTADPSHHQGEGYYLLLYTNQNCKPTAGTWNWRYLPAQMRYLLFYIIGEIFPEDTAAFAKALLLGETDGLSYEEDRALKVSGIRHVVAVSGLHISILYSFVYLFALHKRRLTAILGIPLLILFAAVAGFMPSVVRACIMQILMMLSQLVKKEQDSPTALSIAVLIILLINPLTITSVGFQLSVASVAGILLLYKRISDRLTDSVWTELFLGNKVTRWIMRYVISSISVSLSASLFTVPLCAFYFGVVSLVGIVTNLLCIWSITFLFCGIIICCVVSLCSAPIASALAWLLSWLIRGILLLAGGLSKLPLAAVYTQNPGVVIWLLLSYGCLLLFLLGKWKLPGNPLWYSTIILLAVMVVTWLYPMTEDYRITVLDVGQGQCILLQSEGRTVMVDCGGEFNESATDTAVSYLSNMGIRKLDGLIITHYDADHAGGAPYLMTQISVENLYLPNTSDGEQLRKAILNSPHGKTVIVSTDMLLQWPETKLWIFAPEIVKSGNESSLCVLFQRENCDILITGDLSAEGELELLNRCSLPKVDFLVAGHHGAETSTGVSLLKVTLPDTVLISVGADNRYGHPSTRVLKTLELLNIPVRRTDEEGTIIISEVSLWLRKLRNLMQSMPFSN